MKLTASAKAIRLMLVSNLSVFSTVRALESTRASERECFWVATSMSPRVSNV